MDKTIITVMSVLVIAAAWFSCCTSSSPLPAQPVNQTPTGTEFDHFLLSPEVLPGGLIRAVDGPIEESAVTDLMRKNGYRKGHRALYSDTAVLTGNSVVIVQDIMRFTGADALTMLEDHKRSFADVQGNDITVLSLQDPELGEKSYALKITLTDSTGAETYIYVIGFVQSGIYEVISMEGTPSSYPVFLQLAEAAAAKK
jgi:hypothetical protein